MYSNLVKRIFLLLTISISLIPKAGACTSIIVGKKASVDGSAFITYNQDDYGMFGRLRYFAPGAHPAGTMRPIIDGDTNRPLGSIPEAPYTYAVMGYINEHQVGITETTFGGREELHDTTGIIDYTSLMHIALQRSRTAREAIDVMTSLVEKYGYASEGESFSIVDPNEVWILEMIGKGGKERGAVWVAVRIPDDCIACHANQSRIHRFDMKDKENVRYAKDVITFARKQGYFTGKDMDFSFAEAYAPADFGAIRFCEARVWSFFNRWVEGMERYIDYADGHHIGRAEVMPLYFKPKHKLSLADVMTSMRDHYEGTPFDVSTDIGTGPYGAPYRPTPLTWEWEGKTYFNERPISTQQTAATFILQVRSNLPAPVGGIVWFGNDEPNMVPYTPVYCCATAAPACYDPSEADDVTFSWNSAFWVQNWVANMTYPRYSQLFPDVLKVREQIEHNLLAQQSLIEKQALTLYKEDPKQAADFLTKYSNKVAAGMLQEWKRLGEFLIVKYNDQTIKHETNRHFERDEYGLAKRPVRTGFDSQYRQRIVKETGNRYLLPQ